MHALRHAPLSRVRLLVHAASPTARLLATAVLATLALESPAQQQFAELGQRLPVDSDGTSTVALGDVDGDGDLDMVVGNGDGLGVAGLQNRLYLNDGSGRFSDVTVTQMPIDGERTVGIALGDVDGDGDLDIVLGNYGTCGKYGCTGFQNRLYLNSGSGTFTDATVAQMPVDTARTSAVALGDVDGDGDLDLAVGNAYSQNQLYLNNGSGTFTVAAVQMPFDNDITLALTLGDVDGDGDLDMVIGNTGYAASPNRLYVNDSSGTFTDVTASQLPADHDYTQALALGDVDGDGDLDLILGNYPQQNRLYLNSGGGTFSDATATQMPLDSDPTKDVELGDVDGDGDLDLVCANLTVFSASAPNRLYRNDGSGTFTQAPASQMPTSAADNTWAIALGDVDGDGDLDVAVGISPPSAAFRNKLYINLLRQLDTAVAPQIGQNYTFDVYARYGPPHLFDVAFVFGSLVPVASPLPPYGTLGLDPTQMVPLSLVTVPQPAGVGSVSIAVPNVPAYIGLSIYAQALLFQEPLPARLTNVTRGVVQ